MQDLSEHIARYKHMSDKIILPNDWFDMKLFVIKPWFNKVFHINQIILYIFLFVCLLVLHATPDSLGLDNWGHIAQMLALGFDC